MSTILAHLSLPQAAIIVAMERRRARRLARRLRVRFNARGEAENRHGGFTTNMSTTGMFVTTHHLLKPPVRVHLDVGEEGNHFHLEGVVVRAVEPPRGLHGLQQAGFAVRFLQVADLIAELMPGADEPAAPAPANKSGEPGEPPSPPPPPPLPSLPSPPSPPPPAGEYRLRFKDLGQLVEIFNRELRHGRLFVRSQRLPAIGETVSIVLGMPPPSTATLTFKGRVVDRIEPGPGPNLMCGFAVELSSRAEVLAALRPIVSRSEA
ncbi:MAG: PilZ domain-containing protein [Pseudomonadota bacterium]